MLFEKLIATIKHDSMKTIRTMSPEKRLLQVI